ncbi:riboflavin kinase [Peribacillus huizhouensis]|uniref:riboflavin kinase n=1 Tax=Peribacillus huizhouensis TaxID=1501239 RepID=A0ABR6CU07_9BACI|nr:riboflavin kinase [Peribacillus huizhouensis]MBA9028434.1 riboflavin kinase/FMN adenylyltransferase [Peribacillus huizhouensis]
MNSFITSIHGTVILGKQIGRTIGFPTANLRLLSEIPKLDYGVYGVIVDWKGSKIPGIMNIGIRPTFHDHSEVSYEVHLLDFDEHIYHENINVEICFPVREERFFNDISELVKQIHSDVAYVREKLRFIDRSNQNNKHVVHV